MSLKRLLLGASSYLFIVFPLAYVWHLVLFKDTYARLGYFSREPVIAFGFGSILLQGLLLSYLFPRLYRGGGHLAYGLKFGLIMGLFLWSCHVLAAAAKQDIAPLGTWFVIETFYLALQFGLAGLALAFVYRSGLRRHA